MTSPQLFDLSGKTALITGASGWLGSAMAEGLAEAGASVVVSSRNRERATAVARSLPVLGEARHHGVALDQMDGDSTASGFEVAAAANGRIDILVNNGHEPNVSDLDTVDRLEFGRTLENATGWFDLARRFRDHVAGRGGRGSLIMIGSMYGLVGSYPDAYEGVAPASPVAYHALKGGIIQMTRHLAVYWAGDGLRVNCLSPGPFPGPKAPAEMVERLTEKSPMKRMGRPDELKGALVFLAGEASSYLTGQNLVVDGGWTAW